MLLVLGALASLGWLFWRSWAALLPFQIGAVLAYLILPLVDWLERHIPRWLAIIVVYTGGILLLMSAVAFIVPPLYGQATDAIRTINLPSIRDLGDQAAEMVAAYERTVPLDLRQPLDEAFNQTIRQMQNNLTAYVREAGAILLNSMLQVINTVTFALGFVIVPIWMFYVIKDQRAGADALNGMIPTWGQADFWAVVRIIDRVFSSYIRGQLVLGIAVGTAAWLGLTVLDMAGFKVQYIVLLAVIAGVTELIPLIGPVIGAVPAIVIGFFDSPTTALSVMLLYIAIQQLENNLLVPRIVGESVGIHPAVLMIVFILCSQAFGPIGIIMSAPLAAVVRDVFRYVHGRLCEPPRPAGLLPGELLPTEALPDQTPSQGQEAPPVAPNAPPQTHGPAPSADPLLAAIIAQDNNQQQPMPTVSEEPGRN